MVKKHAKVFLLLFPHQLLKTIFKRWMIFFTWSGLEFPFLTFGYYHLLWSRPQKLLSEKLDRSLIILLMSSTINCFLLYRTWFANIPWWVLISSFPLLIFSIFCFMIYYVPFQDFKVVLKISLSNANPWSLLPILE